MSGDEDYIYDEESGEWMPASELAAKQAAAERIDNPGHFADANYFPLW